MSFGLVEIRALCPGYTYSAVIFGLGFRES